MKKRGKICVSCIIVFVLLSISLITVSAYSNQYPAYLGNYGETAYIELNTSQFGTCSLVFPVSYSENTLSYSTSNIVNVTGSTLYGYLVTSNGSVYDVRAQRLGRVQYSTTSGYQTVYYDVNFNSILNTNIRFTNSDSDNEFVKLSAFQIILLCVLLFLALAETFNGFISLTRRGAYV